MKTGPNYHKIFRDIIAHDFPNIGEDCESILSKASLNSQDVINLNQKIFNSKNDRTSENPKFRSYDLQTIREILKYQRKHELNDTQLAIHFSISRNTIRMWKTKYSSR
ncbi:helix-turn-helix domain-containing protein [Soonwooa sp.]|uniref:helix-turn-helix domain-containing protein n=1 Tax=Soonwooa sp. TaxID=1938592 RepID=UPI00262E53E2|nr:helix-turn-helix domain-containing protein [Soonwooa sp.]